MGFWMEKICSREDGNEAVPIYSTVNPFVFPAEY